jgi:hypothetical protein
MTPEKPVDTEISPKASDSNAPGPKAPEKGSGASKAEHAVRHAPDAAVAPHEKRAIGAETSREEDA